MYPPPHMACMYPPPHMACMYPPPHMACMYPPPHMACMYPPHQDRMVLQAWCFVPFVFRGKRGRNTRAVGPCPFITLHAQNRTIGQTLKREEEDTCMSCEQKTKYRTIGQTHTSARQQPSTHIGNIKALPIYTPPTPRKTCTRPDPH
jgi:hypothetical protein